MLIEKQVFLNAKSVGSHRTVADVELVRCEFTGSNLSQFDDPEMNLIVRDVTVTRCVAKRSSMGGVRFDNVLVDGLSASDGVQLDGCAFRHVTLRGRIGSLMVIPPTLSISQDLQDAFTASIVRYYRDVDWALDISQAEFESVDLYFVPGDLIKRDPETQYLLRRERFAGIDLSDLPLRARIAVGRFESTPFDSIIAIAPKRSKKFHETKSALDELRANGLAE